MSPKPSKFFTRLFRWFCKGDFYEELQGDLEERFYEHVDLYGVRKAQSLYRAEVLKMLRPSVLHTPKVIVNLSQLSLFQIHLKLAIRNIYRHKVFSAVNIFGLGAALATSLFVVNIFYSAFRADHQHTDAQLLHRIVTYENSEKYSPTSYATTPPLLADRIANEMPEAAIVSQVSPFQFTLPSSLEDIEIKGILVDKSFFQLFNFTTIDGNPEKIFDDPKSLIITEDMAERFFPEEDPIGKVTPQGLLIQAVIKSPKSRSHIQFDAIGNAALIDDQGRASPSITERWARFPLVHTYLRLKPGSEISNLQGKLDLVSSEVNELIVSEQKSYQFKTQPVLDIMRGASYLMELGAPLGYSGMKGLAIPMVVLLLLACFNYTNLSIARALQRTREIGIRKTVGSSRLQISGQFLTESVIFSLFALIIGYVIYRYFTPAFAAIDPTISMIFSPELKWSIIMIFIVFATVVGLLAGIFPAIYFSRISPLSAFNSQVKSNPLSVLNLRKVLVTLQITLSMFCIIFVSLNSSQNNQLLQADLGFEKENVLVLRADSLQRTRYEAVLEQVPEVLRTATISSLPGITTDDLMMIIDPMSNNKIPSNYVFVDEGFETLFQPELLTGSFFTTPGTNPLQMEALVNQRFLNHFQINVDSAIGHLLKMPGDVQNIIEIKGVLKDMVFSDPIYAFEDPLIVLHQKAHGQQKYMAIKIQAENVDATLDKLESSWSEANPSTAFEIQFLSDHIEKSYQQQQRFLELLTFLTTVVIGISLLGQLGMALYNAQTRIKEISVRKVLGARLKTIIGLLVKGTVISLLVATVIATPLAQLVFEDAMLQDPRLVTEPGLHEYSRAILGLSAIVILLVITQTIRVARLNPAETLKNE